MFSSAAANALTNFSSWLNSNGKDPVAQGQRAAAMAVQDFCKKANIRPPSNERTVADVGEDMGREIRRHVESLTDQGFSAALKLLNLVKELEYKILTSLVATPLSANSTNTYDPEIFGDQIIQRQWHNCEESVRDLRSGYRLGPPVRHNPCHVGNRVQHKGSVIGMFQTRGDDRSLRFFDLTKNSEIFRVPEADPRPNLLECPDGVYAFTERTSNDGAAYTLYNVTNQTVISEVQIAPRDRVRVQSPQSVLGQIYQIIRSANVCHIYNHSSGNSFTLDGLSNPRHCRFVEISGSVYVLISTDEKQLVFDVKSQKLVASLPHTDRSTSLIGWNGCFFQQAEMSDQRKDHDVYDALQGKRLELVNGTPIRSLARVSEELYASAFSNGIWRTYNWRTGQQVGLESEGTIDVVECNGKAYQLGSNGGLDFTFCLDRGSLCLELPEHVDSYLPVGTNGRAFQSAEIGDVMHHYDLETGCRVLYGASNLVVADGKAVFKDRETERWFLIPIEDVH